MFLSSEPMWRPNSCIGRHRVRATVKVHLPEHRQGAPESVRTKIERAALEEFARRVKETGLDKPVGLEGGWIEVSLPEK